MYFQSGTRAVRRTLQSSLLLAVAACAPAPGQVEYARTHYPVPATAPASPAASTPAYAPRSREIYPAIRDNRAESTYYRPVSTFSIDVDTAAYANVRRYLKGGRLPSHDAVRTEELVNYFTYDYEAPGDPEAPFRVAAQIVPTPWNAGTRLLHIGVRGYDVPRGERPRANLVLLIDVSGSMEGADRLDLLKTAFRFLVDSLRPDDHVAIVTYSGSARVARLPTSGARKSLIISTIDSLTAGGSTAGEDGLRLAYRLAEQHFDGQGINRVILASDGDFNVGESQPEALRRLIARKRESGVYLTVLTVGDDNLNEGIAQALAQSGNGQAAHLDSSLEAQKVLREQLTQTLVPIAKDVKIQLKFNPALVRNYRLLGYETRKLAQEDFANDRVDAG
jgi:Ca-activated chloride channel family protein